MRGSLFNRLAERSQQAEPKVGMGATITFYTDRKACTVVEVSESGKRVVVQEDDAKRIDKNGMSESQSYEYKPNPEGAIHIFTLRKNGRWVRQNEDMKTGTGLLIGERMEYYDYSF